MDTFLKKKAEIDNMVTKVFSELEEEIERDLKSYDVAEWYYNAGDFDTAHNYINKFLSVDPHNAAAQDLLVNIIEGLISTERLPSLSRRHVQYNEAADNDAELEECPNLNMARRYVWQSCQADVNQARLALNSSLDRLSSSALQRNNSELIARHLDIIQRLMDVEIAMFHHDTLSEDNSELFTTEERLVFGEAPETRDDSTALQQMLAQQSQLLEKLTLQVAANEDLLKSAFDEISSLRDDVRSLKSPAAKTEPSESHS